LKPYLRRSIFTKAVALGFIVMILLGNVWLVLVLTGQKDMHWLGQSFAACMVWIALAGCGMGVRMIQHQFRKETETDDDAAV
jgi:TRAP-type C4-dicarboxylate transport system permease small subunit